MIDNSYLRTPALDYLDYISYGGSSFAVDYNEGCYADPGPSLSTDPGFSYTNMNMDMHRPTVLTGAAAEDALQQLAMGIPINEPRPIDQIPTPVYAPAPVVNTPPPPPPPSQPPLISNPASVPFTQLVAPLPAAIDQITPIDCTLSDANELSQMSSDLGLNDLYSMTFDPLSLSPESDSNWTSTNTNAAQNLNAPNGSSDLGAEIGEIVQWWVTNSGLGEKQDTYIDAVVTSNNQDDNSLNGATDLGAEIGEVVQWWVTNGGLGGKQDANDDTIEPEASFTSFMSSIGNSLIAYMDVHGQMTIEQMQSDYVQSLFNQFNWAANASPVDLTAALANAIGYSIPTGEEAIGPFPNGAIWPIVDSVGNFIEYVPSAIR